MNLYQGVAETFRDYWRIYGGFRALIASPYLHFSGALSLILWPLWLRDTTKLYDLIVSAVPSVLGFSLGGYAILLAFGDNEFIRRLSGPDEDGEESPFMDVNATFIHFIVVSVFSLFLAIAGTAWNLAGCFALLSCFIALYSIACALAAAFAIFRVAGWYDIHAGIEKRKDGK